MDSAGNVYVADLGNNRVVKVASNGTQTIIGSQFDPNDVAVDSAGNVYVANQNDAVFKLVPNSAPTVIGWFSSPNGVAVDSAGNIYVADFGNNRVVKVASDGTQTVVGSGFNEPTRVAVDSAGNIYVADFGNIRVVKVIWVPVTGFQGTAVGSGFSHPYGVAVDSAGEVYVADADNNRVVKIALGPAASSSALGSATITWAAPLSNGGAPITSYTVTAADLTDPANGGQTGTPSPPTATTCTIIGLHGGDSYTFTVTATNSVGTGPASNPSNPVTAASPGPPLVSLAPATVTGTTVTLHGTVNPQGAATSYYFQYSSSPPSGSFTTRLPAASIGPGLTPVPVTATITGLQPGLYYYACQLVATNTQGTVSGYLRF